MSEVARAALVTQLDWPRRAPSRAEVGDGRVAILDPRRGAGRPPSGVGARRGIPGARRCCAALVFALLAFAGPLGKKVATAGGTAPDLSAPRAALVKELEALATSANDQRVMRFRDQVFRVLIQLVPDHSRARTALKFRRDPKGGAWLQAPDYREPTDWAPQVLPRVKARLEEALSRYRDAVLFALSSTADLADAVKEQELDDLGRLLPNDRKVHEVRGDVEHEGRWLMPETVAALAERRAFHELVQAGRSMADAGIHRVTTLPKGFVGEGFEYLDGRHRVFGWTGEKWAEESLRFVVIGTVLTAGVTRCEMVGEARQGETLLFPSEKEVIEWMRANPARATAEDLQSVPQVGALSTEDDTRVVYFGREGYRRTSALASAVGLGLLIACPEGEKDGAWVRFGLRNRIIRFITTLRPPQSVVLGGTAAGGKAEAEEEYPPDDLSKWLAAAATRLADKGPERIARVLTVQTNAMSPSDHLVAYALAAYLREGKPDAFEAFLEASRGSTDAREIVRAGLGTDLGSLTLRLRRWLLEQDE